MVESLYFGKRLIVFFSLILAVLQILTVQGFVSVSQNVARVFITPAEVTVDVNQTFSVLVNISRVLKLQGFDFMLSYDTKLLDCLDVEEGTFLSESGPTIVAKLEIDDASSCTCGRIWFAVAIYGPGYSDGNGTLAEITFKALCAGEAVLDLYSDFPLQREAVKLTTCSSEPIINQAIDGLVIITTTSQGEPADPPPDPVSDSPDPPGGLQTYPQDADVNDDGVVNIEDLTKVAVCFGTVRGDLKYNERADLDQDAAISIVDVALVASQIYM